MPRIHTSHVVVVVVVVGWKRMHVYPHQLQHTPTMHSEKHAPMAAKALYFRRETFE